MEVSIVIKMQDGSTKTVELINVHLSTAWSNITPAVPGAVQPDPLPIATLVGTLTLQGQVKDATLLGSI